MMKVVSKIAKCLLVVFFLSMSLGVLWAQGLQNAISGEVRDPTNAVLPGVTVTVTNIATNITRVVVTNEAGNYVVPLLTVGEYTVQAELPGFRTYTVSKVVLQANTAVRVDVVLSVGEITESIKVESKAAESLIRTEDAALGMVLSQVQVDKLPLKGRNFAALAQIVPGANESLDGIQNSLGRTQPLNLSAQGQRHFDNNYLLDGVGSIAGFVNGSTFIPSLEALQEVSVQTGQYSTAFGWFSGAQVDMVVKSGENRLHGSLFEFLRNDALNARRFFDIGDPPPLRLNQFGATIGGPILLPKIYDGRDRSFFFFAYQGERSRRQSTGLANVATEAMRRGDFSQLLPSKVIRDPFTKQPFPGNIIPGNRLVPQALKLMQFIPLPNNGAGALNYINTGSDIADEDQFLFRIDHKISDKNTVFFRGAVRDAFIQNVTINPSFGSFGFPSNHNYVLSLAHTFSPRVFNEFKASYVRESIPTKTGREGAEIDPLRDFGIKGLNFTEPLIRGIPTAAITGYMGTGENFGNPRLLYSNPAVQNQIIVQLRAHMMRFGAESFRRRQQFYAVNFTHQGFFDFTGILSGDAFADFMLGLPDTTRRSDRIPKGNIHQRHVGAYFQDDWRVTSRLTLNLGLRYEFSGSYRDPFGGATNLDFRTLSLFPEPGVEVALNDASHGFAPRIGFASRLWGGTVVRGGFGIFYTQPTMVGATTLARTRSMDIRFFTNRGAPDLTLEDGFRTERAGSPPPLDPVALVKDYGPGYAQTWSVNIQQPLGGGWVSEIGYVGSHTLGLDTGYFANTPPPGPGPVQSRRPLPQFGPVRVLTTDAVASYHALQTRLQSRNWHGFNSLTSYTYAKVLDTASGPHTSRIGTEAPVIQNQNDRHKAERGRAAIDLRHQFKLHTIYDIPWGPVLTGIPRHLVNGWQIAAGLTLHSGPPFTIIVAGNPANTGLGAIRPNRIADGNLPASQRTHQEWFDTNAFIQGPPFTFGNSGRNIIEGPATKVLDISLLKLIRIQMHTLFNSEWIPSML